MQIRLLILDHDDTLVDSTRQIHYPCMLQMLHLFHRDTALPYEEYLALTAKWDFPTLLRNRYHFTEEECRQEYALWQRYLQTHVPDFFPDMVQLLHDFRQTGGKIAVASHAPRESILAAFARAQCPPPEALFPRAEIAAYNKPAPYAVQQCLRRFALHEQQVLVVDDLPVGVAMARAAQVRVAAAGWAHAQAHIAQQMRTQADWYLPTLAALRTLLWEELA